jgi:hypothetical protein
MRKRSDIIYAPILILIFVSHRSLPRSVRLDGLESIRFGLPRLVKNSNLCKMRPKPNRTTEGIHLQSLRSALGDLSPPGLDAGSLFCLDNILIEVIIILVSAVRREPGIR